MTAQDARQVWVGEFDDGEIVVFDPNNQVWAEPDTVYLWSQQTSRSEGYDKDTVKKLINEVKDKARSEAALAKYIVLRDERIKKADEARRQADEAIEQRHRELLGRLGKEYRGIRRASEHGPKRVRITWCWSCKHPLDNRVNLECNACGWILCACGACGCGAP